MTRINLVPPQDLCDQHLLAEFRELTRVPNCVLRGILKTSYPDAPTDYTLGPGHVKFFVDKGKFLYERYGQITRECKHRAFGIYVMPFHEWVDQLKGLDCWRDYAPTDAAVMLNQQRIAIRLPERARWSAGRSMPDWLRRLTTLGWGT